MKIVTTIMNVAREHVLKILLTEQRNVKVKEKILAVAAGIRKREFGASMGKHCDWCDYKNLICPAWEQ